MRIKDANGNLVTMAMIQSNPANVNPDGTIKLPKDYTLEIAQYEKTEGGGGYTTDPRTIIGYGPKNTVDGQTFFPPTMSIDQILEQSASAFVNPKQNAFPTTIKPRPDNEPLSARAENGMIIRWWQTGKEPTSFFPEF
jgi:hypothetical protein